MSDTNTEGSTPQEYVEIPDASYEDLVSFLDDQAKTEFATQEENVDNGEESAPSNEQSAEKESEQSEETNQPEQSAESSEKIKSLEEQLKIEKERHEQQEKFLKRRSTEIGQLRAQIKELQAKLVNDIEEQKDVSPFEALKLQQQLDRVNEEDVKAQNEEREIAHRLVGQKVFETHANKELVNIKTLRQVLESDGLSGEFLNKFEADPYVQMMPETMIQLVKRAEEREKFKSKERELLAQIDELKKKGVELAKRPEDVLNKLQEASRSNGTMKNKSGGSIPSTKTIDFSTASDKELEEYLKQVS